MLDVAIGLVLVFALSSLIVTAVQEAWAACKNRRGENLVKMVGSLVGDNDALAKQILDHPLLKSMAMERKNKDARPPSYLAGDVFVTGLLGFLSKYTANMRPDSPAIMVQELARKLVKDDESNFLQSLTALLPGAEHDWQVYEKRLQAWFEAVGERSSGWYKRENQRNLFLIGLVLAVAMNINPIVICKALWHDAALRKLAVAQAEVALQAYQLQNGVVVPVPGAVVQAGAAPARNVNPDFDAVDKALVILRVNLEKLGEPAAGKQASAQAEELMKARRAVTNLSSFLAKERDTSGNDAKRKAARMEAGVLFDSNLDDLQLLLPAGALKDKPCSPADSILCPVSTRLGEANAALRTAIVQERLTRDALMGNDLAAAVLRARCDEIKSSESAERALCERLQSLGVLSDSTMPIGWSDSNWLAFFGSCDRNKKAAGTSCPESTPWGLSSGADMKNWLLMVAGWLITAMGATLGAPFWFDLLSKLVKMRSSGADPSADAKAKDGAPGAAPSTLTQSGASADGMLRPASSDAMNAAELALNEDDITRIQRSLGIPATEQDGRIGILTRTAISAWQSAHGAVVTGQLTATQIQELLLTPATWKDDDYVG
ncbi:peptidoglycan-binding protein [Massilia sp. BJB1822]|uniref:peptidoglycan-binding domain-containing protein n=1 Tax=Massilia sp. BJB1822 TaxID=2744470 RepID=UPI0015930C07|nr:peptidoglycan-binding domain-containing protein [Massilia sp. BJB1822]NVD97733.1 hypothetical protein [Massilia sp. BJB1822]